MKPQDIAVAVAEAAGAGAAAFEAATLSGSPEPAAIVTGAVSFLGKLMPTNLFGDDELVTTGLEAAIAGGTAYVAAVNTGAPLQGAIISAVVAFLLKLAPTKIIGSPHNP